MPDQITPLMMTEHRSFESDDSTAGPSPAGVSVSNVKKSGGRLYKLYSGKKLAAEPVYAGNYLPPPWTEPEQTRFIDSLVKGMPVQSLCLGFDTGTGKYIVIDGQQRLFSVIRFLSGGDWTLAKLNDIDPRLAGQKASAFLEKDNTLYRLVESYKLPLTIIKYDSEKKSHLEYIFTVFYRLNSGAVRLNNHEMRCCLFSGPFNDFLIELDGDKNWMALNKMNQASEFRHTKQEVILRFLAFYDRYQSYNGRLSFFLNDYMADNRYPSTEFMEEKGKLFRRTAEIVSKLVVPPPLPQHIGISLMVAAMTSVAFNLDFLAKKTGGEIQKMFEQMLADERFSDAKLVEDLSGKERVMARIEAAKAIFGGNKDF